MIFSVTATQFSLVVSLSPLKINFWYTILQEKHISWCYDSCYTSMYMYIWPPCPHLSTSNIHISHTPMCVDRVQSSSGLHTGAQTIPPPPPSSVIDASARPPCLIDLRLLSRVIHLPTYINHNNVSIWWDRSRNEENIAFCKTQNKDIHFTAIIYLFKPQGSS